MLLTALLSWMRSEEHVQSPGLCSVRLSLHSCMLQGTEQELREKKKKRKQQSSLNT